MAKRTVELTDEEIEIITQAMMTAEDGYLKEAADFRERDDRMGDVFTRRFAGKISRLRRRLEDIACDEETDLAA